MFIYRSAGSPTCPAEKGATDPWEFLKAKEWVETTASVSCQEDFPQKAEINKILHPGNPATEPIKQKNKVSLNIAITFLNIFDN